MKTIGSVCLISCALLLSACAVEVSEEEFPEEAAELEGATLASDSLAVAGEVELTEESIENARPSVPPDDATAAGGRYVQPHGDGACHTFDYLRAISNVYCNNFGCAEASDRNYTHGCTGWWGNGARYVWFSCVGC